MHAPRLPFLLPLLALALGCRDETRGAGEAPEPPVEQPTQAPASTAVSPEAAAALQRGREAYARRDSAAAVTELEQAVALAPDWAEAQRALGKLLLSTSTVWFATPTLDRARLERATQALLRAHALEPTHADGAFWAGRALVLGKRGAEGETMLLTALRLDPAHGLACKELGLHYASLGEVERAKAQLARAAELRPEDDEVLFQLGLQLEAEGELVGAIDVHRRALVLNPAHQGPRARLVSLHQRLGQVAEADRAAQELARWTTFGETLRSAMKRHEAAPSDSSAALAVAKLFREAGMIGPARDWLAIALQADPTNAEAAQLLRELGAARADEASTAAPQSQETAPSETGPPR